jgi:4'-phosphopantetheinyl transferase
MPTSRLITFLEDANSPVNSAAQTGYSDDFASLLSNRIHLWITPYMDSRLDTSLSCFRALLTDEERAQEQKFHFQNDRRRFLITRAVLRTTLSRYVGIRAKDWRFDVNAYGKPSVTHAAPLIRRLQFNLSHTRGLIVLAISMGRLVGVDAESTERRFSPLELAERHFASYEATDICGAAYHAQTQRFFEYWTLKEAYVKARGEGLSIALNQFGFQFHQSGVVNMRFHEPLDDSDANWHLWQWSFPKNYLIALCAQNDLTQPAPQVECRQIWPLVAEDRPFLELVRSSR